jgi:hypothetical protein
MRPGDAVALADGRRGTVTGANYWNPEYGLMAMVFIEDGEPGFAKYELVPERSLTTEDPAPEPNYLDLMTEPEYAEAVARLKELARA